MAPLPPEPDTACVSSPSGGTEGEIRWEGSIRIRDRNPRIEVKKDPRGKSKTSR